MSEIWGIFDSRGFVNATDNSENKGEVLRSMYARWHPQRGPHTVARLYTAAEVRAILHDMPEAAARFEGAK